MKILLVNKFLYPNGGSETYIFKLGSALKEMGHSVEYFGMEHEGRIAGNSVSAYTSDMDFHTTSSLKKLTYPLKTIYSNEARKKLRLILDNFSPDICHLNNFNYQLTPSIILEIDRWRKRNNKDCKIIYTAHDVQLVCPNHMCRNPKTQQNCEKCLGGKYFNCTKNRCIHSSLFKSLVGTVEAKYWKLKGVYKKLDKIICPSNFIKTKLDTNHVLRYKTMVLHNFVEKVESVDIQKEDYVLYFGRYSKEKGIETLLKVCESLPEIQFVFAGDGPLNEKVNAIKNIKNIGFVEGEELARLIAKARVSISPSECYENCPFSVMESQMYATPVIASRIGGIPELIDEGVTGELFESGNADELKTKIKVLFNDKEKMQKYSENAVNKQFESIDTYIEKLFEICL